MNPKVSLRTGSYFPNTFLVAAAVVAVVAIPLLTQKPVIAAVMLFASVIVATTHHRLEIDLAAKRYVDGVWVLGLLRGDQKSFGQIDYLYIKQVRVSQKMQLRVASSTIHKIQFEAFVRFSEDHKIHLFTADNKTAMLKKLNALAKILNTPVVDYSEAVNS